MSSRKIKPEDHVDMVRLTALDRAIQFAGGSVSFIKEDATEHLANLMEAARTFEGFIRLNDSKVDEREFHWRPGPVSDSDVSRLTIGDPRS